MDALPYQDITAATPADRRRSAWPSMITLLLGTGLQFIAWLLLSRSDPTTSFERVARGDGRADLVTALVVASIPFWIFSVAVYHRLAALRAPRWSGTGSVLLATGLCGLAVNSGTEIMTQSLTARGVVTAGEAADAAANLTSVASLIASLMFLVGVAVGLPVLAVALWRSRAVPRAVPLLLVGFLAVDLVAQGARSGALGALAHGLAFAAAVWTAAYLVAPPSDQGA